MRADIGDAMDDTLSEDTLMECIDDQDYDNLAEVPNNTKSTATIRGAVEKLLTLLESDEDEELLSCSEDEGVEADLSENEECFDDNSNLKVLYQLAVLLTEELKCPVRKSNWCGDMQGDADTCNQNMEGVQRLNNQCNEFDEKCIPKRDDDQIMESGLHRLSPEVEMKDDTCMWTAGWDACTAETLRYLVEVEGLPVHHPTVLAMKNHLQTQRERFLCKT